MTRKELRAGQWLKINVTTMVVEFCRLPRENLAIVVRVQNSKNRMSLVVPHPSSESNNALMPYIEVSLNDNSHKRTRRNIGIECTENSKETRCCRYPLVVNFEEFGWDWIIAPKVYDANYCSGECPYSFLQKYPHTHLVHLAAPQGSGGPCCAPRRMSSITMLYFDHDYNIIYGTIPDTRRHNHFKGLKIMNFKIPTKVVQSELDEAVLNLHIQDLETGNNTIDPTEPFTISLQVSRITRNNQGSRASVPYTNNSLKMMRKELREGKWLKINVTAMLAEFCRLPRENLAIIVRVQDSKNRMSLVVPHPSSESNNALMPYIDVSLADNAHRRTRRNIGLDCTENSKETRCCRYPLVVNFEEFGWDWIIAPKSYEMNYCSGECPYVFLQRYPHTHLAHLAAPQGHGGPCCAPRKMSSLSMLFFDSDFNIIYGTFPGMVVESCGCS